ncbi:uncharacterized protein VTP21DRAFT_5064 [Calcarisporiella thermophila]|uniref:uncharacterized protein n=1 Tax=Calcarisporiella thermophila TaxID=911321 RepID=UPI0037436BDB
MVTSLLSKKTVGLEIHCPDNLVFEGEEIRRRRRLSGKIRVETAKPLQEVFVSLSFKGICTIRVPDVGGHFLLTDTSGKGEATQVLKQSRIFLMKEGLLAEGMTDLFFELSIPGDVPPSFSHPKGSVTYTLSAKLIHRGFTSTTACAKKQLTIEHHFVPRHYGLDHTHVPEVCYRGMRAATRLTYEVCAPRWVDTASGLLPIVGRISPEERVRHISARLIQEEAFSFPNSAAKDIGDPMALALASIPHIDRIPISSQTLHSHSSSVNLSFLLKHPALRPQYKSPLIRIEHFLELEIHLTKEPILRLRLPLTLVAGPPASNETENENGNPPPYQLAVRDHPPYYQDGINLGNGETRMVVLVEEESRGRQEKRNLITLLMQL